MRGAAGIGLGTTIKQLRRAMSGAAGNGLGAAMKYLRSTTSAAANNCLSITITLPCSAASFEFNSEPHTGARTSVRLCVVPELARCVHCFPQLISHLFITTGVAATSLSRSSSVLTERCSMQHNDYRSPLVELANTTDSVKGSTKRGIIVQAQKVQKYIYYMSDYGAYGSYMCGC
jgi:hypothetical protein